MKDYFRLVLSLNSVDSMLPLPLLLLESLFLRHILKDSWIKVLSAKNIFIEVRTRHWRTRTVKVRTALSHPCPAGQTDNGQLLFYNPDRIRKADRIGYDFPENPDKNETRTGHGQCCPPTSGSNQLSYRLVQFFFEMSKFWNDSPFLTSCSSMIVAISSISAGSVFTSAIFCTSESFKMKI